MARSLTNAQWRRVKPLIPEAEVVRTTPRGGRPWRDPRDVLDAVLWVLRTGSPWADLPRRYPPPQTCHRRFQKWSREGVLDAVLHALGEDVRGLGLPASRMTDVGQPPVPAGIPAEIPVDAAA